MISAGHTAFGETKSLKEWLRDPRCGQMSYAYLCQRAKIMPIEKAMDQSVSALDYGGLIHRRKTTKAVMIDTHPHSDIWAAIADMLTAVREDRLTDVRDTALRVAETIDAFCNYRECLKGIAVEK